MAIASAELFITFAVIVLVAVAAGTLTARLFMAASRPRPTGAGPATTRPARGPEPRREP